MIKKLDATKLGTQILVEDKEGVLKAYNNVSCIAFVTVAGKVGKYDYEKLSLKENVTN